jgi:glutathione S-transferase
MRLLDANEKPPKPDLTPLTGGYRRIPVMQVGADIYCDTALIIRRLDELYPQKPVIPTKNAGLATIIEDWADHRVFSHAVPPVVVALADALPEGFFEDRGAMTPAFDKETLISAAPVAFEQVGHVLNYLDEQLQSSAFVLGEEFTVADAACFHTIKFLKNDPSNEAHIDARPAVASWVKRIEDFGPGKVETMTPADALASARDAEPSDVGGESVAASDYAIGDVVTIIADDYGQETTSGKVTRILKNQISVVREDDNLGAIAVHYPRAGYRVIKNS